MNDSLNISNLIRAGFNLIHQGRMAEAEALTNEIASKLPPKWNEPKLDAQLSMMRGVIFYQTKRYAEAKHLFEKVLELDSQSLEGMTNLAATLDKLNNQCQAKAILKRAIGLNKESDVPVTNLGNLLFKEGKDKEAKTYYLTALRLNPKNDSARINLARIYLEDNEYQLCIATSADLLNKKNQIGLANLYLAYKLTSDFESAKAILKKIETLPPQGNEELRIFGFVGYELGDLKKIEKLKNFLPIAEQEKVISFSKTSIAKSYFGSLRNTVTIKSVAPEFSNEPRILVAGTKNYIDKYFSNLMASWGCSNKEYVLHLHIYDDGIQPAGAFKDIYSADERLHITQEIYNPKHKTGYTTRRFLRAAELLSSGVDQIIVADIDLEFLKPLAPIFSEQRTAFDVALQRRTKEIYVNQIYNASLSVFNNTTNTQFILNSIANYIAYLEVRQRLNWFADQLAILSAVFFAKRYRKEMKILELPDNIVSHDNKSMELAYVRHFKGNKDE